jgi:protein-tyrosine phosphatase
MTFLVRLPRNGLRRVRHPAHTSRGRVAQVASDFVAVLVVCTANRCRSPIGEALLSAGRGESPIVVRSAGFLEEGQRVDPHAVAVAATAGLSIEDYRSRQLNAARLERADLVLCMTIGHLQRIVTLEPAFWPKTFSFLEFAELLTVGPQVVRGDFQASLSAVQLGRNRSDLMARSRELDVSDPVGQGRKAFSGTLKTLHEASIPIIAWLSSVVSG